jgi:hypothetical protein
MEVPILRSIQQLEEELFQANYAVKYYSDKLCDLSTQIEQLALLAAEPSLKEFTSYLSLNLIDSKSQLLQDLLIGYLSKGEKGFFNHKLHF